MALMTVQTARRVGQAYQPQRRFSIDFDVDFAPFCVFFVASTYSRAPFFQNLMVLACGIALAVQSRTGRACLS